MRKSRKHSVDRREFLKGATAGAAAAAFAANPLAAQAKEIAAHESPAPRAKNASAPLPQVYRDVKDVDASNIGVITVDRPGSDFMVDVIKTIGFEYVCANPGNTFRSLHESIINYGNNQAPEFITCCHEEAAVGMGHGYAKIEGKPLLVCVHGTVGAQHAAMAIYDAFCDVVPVSIILGNIIVAT